MNKVLEYLVGATPFYQTAYVTNDTDQALDTMKHVYGINDFMDVRGIEFDAGHGRKATINMALAWRGDTQYEIIEPISGAVDMYRTLLPAGGDFAMRFHHYCQSFDTEEEVLAVAADLRAAGVPIPIEQGLDGNAPAESLGTFFYADFTASLGHYLEFCWFTEQGKEFLSAAPRTELA